MNTQEQQSELIKLGWPAEKIFVCGMTLKPRAHTNAASVKKKFDIQPDEKVILVASGSLGWGISPLLLEQLSQLPQIKVIVLCGKNQELFAQLTQTFADKLLILGYYSPLDELYAITDIFLSKPGGLSISEALRWRLPILVTHMIPGQEELNYIYLLKYNLIMAKSTNLVASVRQELATGQFHRQLQNNPSLDQLFPPAGLLIKAIQSVC